MASEILEMLSQVVILLANHPGPLINGPTLVLHILCCSDVEEVNCAVWVFWLPASAPEETHFSFSGATGRG